MTREEVREGIEHLLATFTGEGDFTTELLDYLDSQSVVIRGETLGFSHPHLAEYYTVEPLI